MIPWCATGATNNIVLLPGQSQAHALGVVRQMRRALKEFAFLAGEGFNIRLTASFGIATLPRTPGTKRRCSLSPTGHVRSKGRGKDRIMMGRDLTPAPEESGPVSKKLLDLAREVLTIEAEGLAHLVQKLDQSFVRAVDLIYRAKGRVILAGVGKSGIVARKMVATFNSTGTRAIFLHPVEAMHGSLGMVSRRQRHPGPVRPARPRSSPSCSRASCAWAHRSSASPGGPTPPWGGASLVVIDTRVPREAPAPWGSRPRPTPRPCWPWGTPWRWCS